MSPIYVPTGRGLHQRPPDRKLQPHQPQKTLDQIDKHQNDVMIHKISQGLNLRGNV